MALVRLVQARHLHWMKLLATLITGAALAGLAAIGPAFGQALVSTGESFVSVRMLPGQAVAPGQRMAGLRLSLKPGWKTYWRSPGEAGVPPQFDWSGSTNLRGVEILWPRPSIYHSFGMETIGYSDQIVLPIMVTAADPLRPIGLNGVIDLGVCRHICVLERVTVAETIAPDMPSIGAAQIDRAYQQVPLVGDGAGLTRAECQISGAGEERRLSVRLGFNRSVSQPVVLFEGQPDLWISDAKTKPGGHDVHATASLTLLGGGWIDRSKLRMTVLADGFAADVRGCAAPKG